MTTENF